MPLALLLAAAVLAGGAAVVPDDFGPMLEAERRSAEALARGPAPPRSAFEGVVSQETFGKRRVVVTITRGLVEPHRLGPFVALDRHRVTLQGVAVQVDAGREDSATPPLALMVASLERAVSGLLPSLARPDGGVPLASVPVEREGIAEITARPFSARLALGERVVDLRATLVRTSAADRTVRLTGLSLTTGSERLEAEEALLGPGGDVAVFGRYRLTAPRSRSGVSATFRLDRTGLRLVARRPTVVPVGDEVSEAMTAAFTRTLLRHAFPGFRAPAGT